MKKLIAILLVCVGMGFAPIVQAQTANVTYTGLLDHTGAPLTGSVCFGTVPVNTAYYPPGYPGVGQATTIQCSAVTTGTMTPIVLNTAAVQAPEGVCYQMTVQDTLNGGYTVNLTGGYACITFTGDTNMATVPPTYGPPPPTAGTPAGGYLKAPVPNTALQYAYTTVNGVICALGGACNVGGGGGGGSPTGNGFYHVTGGVMDPAARAVDISSSDVTGTLGLGSLPTIPYSKTSGVDAAGSAAAAQAASDPVGTAATAIATVGVQGAWSNAFTYVKGVVVSQSNITYYSLQAVPVNQNPATATAYWAQLPVNFSQLIGTAGSAQLPTTVVYTNQAQAYSAGFKQSFTPSSTTAGERSVGVTADPSGLAEGDHWYRSDTFRFKGYANSTVQTSAWLSDIPSALPPNGGASGDLSGSYPGPTVAQVNGAIVPASAALLATNSSRQFIAASTVAVGSGGTGNTTFTAHGVLIAEGTASFAVTAVGTTGQCFLGATGADPGWGTCPGGSSGINTGTANSVPYYATTSTISGVSGTGVPVFSTGAAPTFTPVAGAGAAFTTGPASGTTANVLAVWSGTTGQLAAGSVAQANVTLLTGTQTLSGVNTFSHQLNLTVGTAIASASTIAPTTGLVHITGTTTINTITALTGMSGAVGGCINLIPDGLWSTGTSGNIVQASTASVNRVLTMCYDPGTVKWYPSY